MRFINNPFNLLLEVVKEEYPQADCDIIFGEQLTDGIRTFGCTLFPEDEGERIVVEVHSSLTLTNATEILAHELAHVVAGEKAGHDEEWEKAFSTIHEKFKEKLDERFDMLMADEPIE